MTLIRPMVLASHTPSPLVGTFNQLIWHANVLSGLDGVETTEPHEIAQTAGHIHADLQGLPDALVSKQERKALSQLIPKVRTGDAKSINEVHQTVVKLTSRLFSHRPNWMNGTHAGPTPADTREPILKYAVGLDIPADEILKPDPDKLSLWVMNASAIPASVPSPRPAGIIRLQTI